MAETYTFFQWTWLLMKMKVGRTCEQLLATDRDKSLWKGILYMYCVGVLETEMWNKSCPDIMLLSRVYYPSVLSACAQLAKTL